MNVSGITLIYGLFDPIDGALRYIGRTRNSLKERLTNHCSAPSNKKMRKWIGDLAMRGYRPRIERLSTCISRDEGHEETRIIERYSAAPLLNDRKFHGWTPDEDSAGSQLKTAVAPWVESATSGQAKGHVGSHHAPGVEAASGTGPQGDRPGNGACTTAAERSTGPEVPLYEGASLGQFVVG